MVNNDKTVNSVATGSNIVCLRTGVSNKTPKATFEYSLDSIKFTPFSNEVIIMWFSLKIFTEDKFCLFNYPAEKTGGFYAFYSRITQNRQLILNICGLSFSICTI